VTNQRHKIQTGSSLTLISLSLNTAAVLVWAFHQLFTLFDWDVIMFCSGAWYQQCKERSYRPHSFFLVCRIFYRLLVEDLRFGDKLCNDSECYTVGDTDFDKIWNYTAMCCMVNSLHIHRGTLQWKHVRIIISLLL